MTRRIVDAESYIYSAIIFADKNSFTTNEIANILIDRFSLPKSLHKAKAFSYHQLQMFVHKGLLDKCRQRGIYQHLYSKTEKFNSNIINAKLLPGDQLIMGSMRSESDDKKMSAVHELLEKYEVEFERVSGLIEIYDELSIKVPEREREFKSYSLENVKKSIRINAKIKALITVGR